MTYTKTSKINQDNLEIELDEKLFVKYCNFVIEPDDSLLNKCVVVNSWNPYNDIPICELSSYKNQTNSYGIVSKIDGMNVFCNSNMAWVMLGDNESLKSGILLTTSCVGGVLQKQDDDIVHVHTVAKTLIEYEKSVPTNCYTIEGYNDEGIIRCPIVAENNSLKTVDFPKMMYWNIEMNKKGTLSEYMRESLPKVNLKKLNEPSSSRLVKSTATTLRRTNSNVSLASFRPKTTPKQKTEIVKECPIRNIVRLVLLPVHVY
jgi:hypothetical protein